MTNIEKLIERMKWQAIDSAPKDETRILIDNSNWCREDSPEIASWNEDNNAFYTDDGMKYQEDELEYWRHIPTGKDGEIVRVLVDALEEIGGLTYDDFEIGGFLGKELPETYREQWILETKSITRKALAKAEELAGEV